MAGVFVPSAAVLAWTEVLMVPTWVVREAKAGVFVPRLAVLAYTAVFIVPTVP